LIELYSESSPTLKDQSSFIIGLSVSFTYFRFSLNREPAVALDTRVRKMPTIHPLYFSTSRLRGFTRGVEVNSATAFFWAESSRTFVVTNKHVILGRDFVSQPRPVTDIRLRCHTTANLNLSSDIDIPLFQATVPLWLEHIDPSSDVVLIPIDDQALRGITLFPFSTLIFQRPTWK